MLMMKKSVLKYNITDIFYGNIHYIENILIKLVRILLKKYIHSNIILILFELFY